MPDQQTVASGIERVSVLLLSLGEPVAAQVICHFTPGEAEQVGSAMIRMNNPSRSEVDEVVEDFLCQAEQYMALGTDSERYVRNVFTDAFSAEKARILVDRLVSPCTGKGLEMLRWMDAPAIAELVGFEHPQIVAVILACLDSAHGAKVLSHLPASKRSDVLIRISRLDGVRRTALEALDEVLVHQCSRSAAKSARMGGLKLAADILSHTERSLEGAIMDELQIADAELGQQLQELRLDFDFLLKLNDVDAQTLLKAVSQNVLSTALVGVDGPLAEKIVTNLPRRQADILRAQIDENLSVESQAVERARQEILSIMRRMADAGDIMLAS
ncbi:MAG: flagellar motor switch protein FliG, partial [Gammaproteobacteria bacterium]